MSNPLSPLYAAVAWVVKQIYDVLTPVFGASSGWTWALTIIIIVLLMRLIMVPLFIKQMRTTRAMSALAPQINELRKKYKNDRQTLNQETMKLYRDAGVNPLMGCLPMLGQAPLFFGLFRVLEAISQYRGVHKPPYGLTVQMVENAQKAKIFGASISDRFLSSSVPVHAKVVIVVAVLLSAVTAFLSVRQGMKRGMTPTGVSTDSPMAQSQKYMQYVVPLFALDGLWWQFGLTIYLMTTNVWTMGQQFVLLRKFPLAHVAAGTGGQASGGQVPGKAGAGKPGGAGRSAGGQGTGGGTRGQQRRGAAPTVRGGGNGAAAGARKSSPDGAGGGGSGVPSANGGGMLRRLGRGRNEPEPEPEPAEVKLVRQQRQRQSRSKRSGKR